MNRRSENSLQNRTASRALAILGLTSVGLLLGSGACNFKSCEDTRTCAPDPSPSTGGSSTGLGGGGGMGGTIDEPLICEPNEIACDGACVDPLVDENFCGAEGDCQGQSVGEQCASDLLCESGVCVAECDGGLISCDGECINPLLDEEHCGAANLCVGRPDSGRECEEGALCLGGECRSWQGATTHSAFGASNIVPSPIQIGIDAQGNVIAAFDHDHDLFSMAFDSATQIWTAGEPREEEDEQAGLLDLAVSPDGQAELIWGQLVDTLPGIRTVTYDSLDWLPDFTQDQIGGTGTLSLGDGTVVFDHSGRSHTGWTLNAGGGAIVYSRTRAAGETTWSDENTVKNLSQASMSELQLVPLGADGVMAIWRELLAGEEYISSATKFADAEWEVLEEIDLTSAGEGGIIHVLAAAGSVSGNAIVVWSSDVGIFSSYFVDGAWDEPVEFWSWDEAEHLRLVFEPTGTVMSLAVTEASSLRAQRFAPSENEWEDLDATQLTANTSAVDQHDLAVDGSGNLTAVWVEADNAIDSIWASRFDAESEGWSDPFLLEKDTVAVESPKVVSNDVGQTMVVWWQSVSAGVIGHNRFW